MSYEVFRLKSLYLGNTVVRGAKITTNNASTTSTIEVDPELNTYETGANYLIQTSLEENQFKGYGTFNAGSKEVTDFSKPSKREVQNGDIIRFDSDERFFAITGIEGSTLYLVDPYEKFSDEVDDTRTGVCTLRKIKIGSARYEYAKTFQEDSGMFFNKEKNAWGVTGIELFTKVSGVTGYEQPFEGDPLRFKFRKGVSSNHPDLMTVKSTEPRKKLITNTPIPISELALDPLPYPHESLKVYWSLEGKELKLKEDGKDYVVNYSQEESYKFPYPAYEEREIAYIKFLDELNNAPQVDPIDATFEGVLAIKKTKEVEGGEPLITPVTNIIPDTEIIQVNGITLTKDDQYKIDYPGGVVFLTEHYNSEEIIGSIATRKRVLWDGMSVVRGIPEGSIVDKKDLIVGQGFTGIGINDPLYFEDREENHLFPSEDYNIDYTSGALMFSTPLSTNEAVLASYYVEGEDVESERVEDLRLNKYPLLSGTVRLTMYWSQKNKDGIITRGSRRLSEGDDFEISYLTGKIKIFNTDALSDSLESLMASYTPLSLLHTVLQVSKTSGTSYRMTVLNDTLDVSSEGNYSFIVNNPAVSVLSENPFKKPGDSSKYSYTGDIEEGSLTNLRVIGRSGASLNSEGYEYSNKNRMITLDPRVNNIEITKDSIITAAYTFESEVLPYAPIQVLFNILEEGSNTLLIEGFDRRDIIKGGDVLRIDNTIPEATYYLRVKSVDYVDENTIVEFYGEYPEDVYNPIFYVLDKSIDWSGLPEDTRVNTNVSVGNDTLEFTGKTLELMGSLSDNNLLMINGSDIYLILSSKTEGGSVYVTIFPSLTKTIHGDIAVSKLPLYTLDGVDLITEKFALVDPLESSFKVEYVVPSGFEGNAKIQVDSTKVTLIESLTGKTNDDYYEFKYTDYPKLDSLASAIQDTVSTFDLIDTNYPSNYKPFKVTNFLEGADRDSESLVPFEEDITISLPFTVGVIPELYKRKLIRTEKDKNKMTLIDVDRSSALAKGSLLAYRSNVTGVSYYHQVLSSEYLTESNKTEIVTETNFQEHTVEPGVFIKKNVNWVNFASELVLEVLGGDTLLITAPQENNAFELLEGLVNSSIVRFKEKEIRLAKEVLKLVDAGRGGLEVVRIILETPLDTGFLVTLTDISNLEYTQPEFYGFDSSLVFFETTDHSISLTTRDGKETFNKIGSLVKGSLLRFKDTLVVGVSEVEEYTEGGLGDGLEVVKITFNYPINPRLLATIMGLEDIRYTSNPAESFINFNDKYSRYILTGEHKLIYEEDYIIEGGDASLTNPISLDDRFRINYQGLNDYPEEEGKSITCTCRFFTELPKGSSLEVYMDFLNRDQFYIQTLTERHFLEIESLPEIEDIAKQKGSGGGSGDEVGGDDTISVHKGGIENLEYLLRDEEIKKDIYLRVYKWYKDRLRNFASELQVIDGFRFGNCQHVVKIKGLLSIKDGDVEDHNYTLTTNDDIEQIANGFSVFFPVGYEGASPKYYDRFSSTFKLSEDVYFYNLEWVDDGGAIKRVGRVKASNPGWANTEPTTYDINSYEKDKEVAETVTKTMETVDYKILKEQKTNLISNYEVPITDVDRDFPANSDTYSFLKRVQVGDKVKIDGKKTFYEITNIIVVPEVDRLEPAALANLSEKWDKNSAIYKQLKNYNNTPFELMTLEEGKYFKEDGIPTYRMEGNSLGSLKYSIRVGTDGSGKPITHVITREEFESSMPIEGYRAIVERANASAKDFPMWDDEGSFGSKIVGSRIDDHVKNKDRIRKRLPLFMLFAAFLPPSLMSSLEPSKNFRMKVDSPDEEGMEIGSNSKELDLKGLNFFEERRVSDTIDALINGVDQDGPRFSDVARISFERYYDKDEEQFLEGLVFRSKSRDSWMQPFVSTSDSNDVIEDYGLIAGNVYKNFYDPDNIFRHLLREKQAWQLLELVDKDLFYFDNKLARCFIDGSIDFSMGDYGINNEGAPVDPSKFRGYLLSALDIIGKRLVAYETHLRFLTADDSRYQDKKEYGSVRNILTPDITRKSFTNQRSYETHEEDSASSEIAISYEQTSSALQRYKDFEWVTGVYKQLVSFWKTRVSENYKTWCISLEKGILYQREARKMAISGSLELGPVEHSAFKLSVRSAPEGFTVQNLTFKSSLGQGSGLGELVLRYDLIHGTSGSLSELGIRADFPYYQNIGTQRHKTLSEFMDDVNSYTKNGVSLFSLSSTSDTDFRVLDRSGVSFFMDTRNIVVDETEKSADGNTINVVGVPDQRLYDSRVLFLDGGYTDRLIPESGTHERPFPVYVKNGNSKKEALEDLPAPNATNIEGKLPVAGDWVTSNPFDVISIKSVGNSDLLVTFDDIDIMVEDAEGKPTADRVELITNNSKDLISFQDNRPPRNPYSASESLVTALWERNYLDTLFDQEKADQKLLVKLLRILKEQGEETGSYTGWHGLESVITYIESPEKADLKAAVIRDLSHGKFGGSIGSTVHLDSYDLYLDLAKAIADGTFAVITPEEYRQLRSQVPTERPSTKILKNIVLLRKGKGTEKYRLLLDLGMYPTVGDLVDAINSVSWEPNPEYSPESPDSINYDPSESRNIPGSYVFGKVGSNLVKHFEASIVGGDAVRNIAIQNLDVSYEEVTRGYRIYDKSKPNGGDGFVEPWQLGYQSANSTSPNDRAYIVGWRISYKSTEVGNYSVNLRVLQNNYSIGSTQKFSILDPNVAQKHTKEKYGIDTTPFHVYCWDEEDSNGNRYFEISNNILTFKSQNVNLSIPLSSGDRSLEGETLNELMERINSDPRCNKFFYCNLRWDRGTKRGPNRDTRGYFEYTYLPDQKSSLPKSQLDRLNLMRDAAISATSSEDTEIRISEKSSNPTTPVFDASLPDRVLNTPLSEYPIYRSSTFDVLSRVRSFSVTPNKGFYKFSNLTYNIDASGKTLAFSGNYTTEISYEKEFLFSNISYNTISELIYAINNGNAIPVVGGQLFTATLVPGADGDSTDLLAASGSLSVSTILRKITDVTVMVPNPTPPPALIPSTSSIIENAIILSVPSFTGAGWSILSPEFSIPATRDRIVLTATIRYSGSLTSIVYNTNLFTVDSLSTQINTERHLGDGIFEPFFRADVLRPALGPYSARDLIGTLGFEALLDIMYGKLEVSYSFSLNGSFTDIVGDVNAKEPFTGLTLGIVSEGYSDLPSELLIPMPTYTGVTTKIILDADFRAVTALEFLHMEYVENKGVYSVTSSSLNAFSGEYISNNLSTDLVQFVKDNKGDYDIGFLSINILPILRRGFGKLGIVGPVDMHQNEATKSYFGVMGDIRFLQISDYDITILLNSTKKRLSKPWATDTTDWFTDDSGEYKNVLMRNLFNRKIAPLVYDDVPETLKQEMTLVEDGVYNSGDGIHNGYSLGLGTEDFLKYLKFERAAQIKNSIISEQIISKKYLWLYLKFHREFGCDQKVKAITRRLEEDGKDLEALNGA